MGGIWGALEHIITLTHQKTRKYRAECSCGWAVRSGRLGASDAIREHKLENLTIIPRARAAAMYWADQRALRERLGLGGVLSREPAEFSISANGTVLLLSR